MSQYQVYPNPGSRKDDIPFIVVIQNDHVSNRTGTFVVIPLRADIPPVEVVAPLVEVVGHGNFVLSTAEIFAIDKTRLRNPVCSLGLDDRAKIRPALDKIVGDY